MEAKIKLLLIDDHTLFREGLARLLAAESGLELVGSFPSTESALRALGRTSVDMVLLDFDLGEKNAFEFLRMFRQCGYEGRVLMVTGGMSAGDTSRALNEGVAGIFLKHNPPSELITAIFRVARGETWMDFGSLQALMQINTSEREQEGTPKLNDREQAVLKGVFEGLTNKEISTRLGISESYVKAVLQQLFTKTGVRTRSQLVRVALERHFD